MTWIKLLLWVAGIVFAYALIITLLQRLFEMNDDMNETDAMCDGCSGDCDICFWNDYTQWKEEKESK